MSVLVFVGPTLTRAEVTDVLDAVCLPPVAQGDLYRALGHKPRAIGIVDGYFHGVPSVWHKEILWAMSQGIAVYGAASMGALRAAELADFGMVGVGRIYQDYRDGTLEDDDEVAVVHGPAELDFTALSEPMVNVRATLDRAHAERIIDDACESALLAAAKATYYPERTWDDLIAQAKARGLGGIDRFADWLTDGRVDQKRLDALAMLVTMAAALAKDDPPPSAAYDFEWTQMWDQGTARWLRSSERSSDSDHTGHGAVLDELRLRGDELQDIRHAAILRLLALKEAARSGVLIDRQAHREKLGDHRAALGLYSRGELDEWLADNGLEVETFERLLGDELRIDRAIGFGRRAIEDQMIAVLQLSGNYADLAQRAREKAAALAESGKAAPEDTGLNGADLVRWYLEQSARDFAPENIDAWLEETGLGSPDELYRLLAREFLFLNS